MNPSRWAGLLAIAILAALASAADAQQITPRIGYIYPAGGRQATKFWITVGGKYLDGTTAAYCSGGGVESAVVGHYKPKRSPTPAIAESVSLHIKIASNAEPGQRELRLVTAAGLTNPLAFYVGQLPEFPNRENEGDGPEPRSPNPIDAKITLPSIVNGQILPGNVDRYRFQARKGTRLVVAVSARDLIPYLPDAVPGWFQAVAALYDSAGNEVAYADDYRFHPDPILYYKILKDGQYTLEIRDSIYRGREDFVYRIAVGEIPFVTGIFPLGGRAGQLAAVDVRGWNLPETRMSPMFKEPGVYPLFLRKQDSALSERRLEMLLDDKPERTASTAPENLGTELSSNWVSFAVDPFPDTPDVEPNNTIDTAQLIKIPTVVNGRIDKLGDRDVFRFEGRAGEQIVAEIYARRLGSPVDSLLKLTDSANRPLAINDDTEDKGTGLLTHHADSLLNYTLAADGMYYLHIVDAQRKGGDEYTYRLRVSLPRPDFQLRIVPSNINVRAAGTVPITVYALRKDGFAGEIELALRNAPSGFTLSGARVPAGQDQVRLTLTAPTVQPKTPVSLRLDGTAMIGSARAVRTAVPTEDMLQAFAYHHLVPTQELKATILSRASATASLVGQPPIRIPVGGTAKVQFAPPAGTAPFTGDLRVDLDDPPEGIAIASQARSGSSNTEVVLQSDAKKVKPGLKGNLIVKAFRETETQTKTSKPARQRSLLGLLPAIPFEVVEK